MMLYQFTADKKNWSPDAPHQADRPCDQGKRVKIPNQVIDRLSVDRPLQSISQQCLDFLISVRCKVMLKSIKVRNLSSDMLYRMTNLTPIFFLFLLLLLVD